MSWDWEGLNPRFLSPSRGVRACVMVAQPALAHVFPIYCGFPRDFVPASSDNIVSCLLLSGAPFLGEERALPGAGCVQNQV